MALSQLELQSVMRAPVMDHGTTVLSCLWVNASLCAHSFMKPVCAIGPHAHPSSSLALCCEHIRAALFPVQVLGSLCKLSVILENCRLFRISSVTSMWFESQKPEPCGNSKQKRLCVYEYLNFACAEMWTFQVLPMTGECGGVLTAPLTGLGAVWRSRLLIMMSSVHFKVGKTRGIHQLQPNTPCVAFTCTTCIVFSPTIFKTCVLGNRDTCLRRWVRLWSSADMRCGPPSQLAWPIKKNQRSFRKITPWTRRGCCRGMFWRRSEECETPVWRGAAMV